jgi:hypothetical protein
MRLADQSYWLATQTEPGSAASSSGPAGTGIVATIAFVVGSTRNTAPASQELYHTAPSTKTIPPYALGPGTRAITVFVAGSIRTRPCVSTVQSEPAP